jgi:hypothetical protein
MGGRGRIHPLMNLVSQIVSPASCRNLTSSLMISQSTNGILSNTFIQDRRWKPHQVLQAAPLHLDFHPVWLHINPAKGQFTVPDDFNAPLQEGLLREENEDGSSTPIVHPPAQSNIGSNRES